MMAVQHLCRSTVGRLAFRKVGSRPISRCLSVDASQGKLGSVDEPYDVVISGGGMVGTCLASALGRTRCVWTDLVLSMGRLWLCSCVPGKQPELRDKRVLLLEASESAPSLPAADKLSTTPFSNRVSALRPDTVRYFEGGNQCVFWQILLCNQAREGTWRKLIYNIFENLSWFDRTRMYCNPGNFSKLINLVNWR